MWYSVAFNRSPEGCATLVTPSDNADLTWSAGPDSNPAAEPNSVAVTFLDDSDETRESAFSLAVYS